MLFHGMKNRTENHKFDISNKDVGTFPSCVCGVMQKHTVALKCKSQQHNRQHNNKSKSTTTLTKPENVGALRQHESWLIVVFSDLLLCSAFQCHHKNIIFS